MLRSEPVRSRASAGWRGSGAVGEKGADLCGAGEGKRPGSGRGGFGERDLAEACLDQGDLRTDGAELVDAEADQQDSGRGIAGQISADGDLDAVGHSADDLVDEL